jgi:D-alanyl-D-alanine dipeptidase
MSIFDKQGIQMTLSDVLTAESIPTLKSPRGWKERSLRECGEALIALSTLKNARILAEPAYFRQGIPGAIEEIYLREGVARQLGAVAARLPTGYRLLVWDVWRPLTVQQALFEELSRLLRTQIPSLSEDEIRSRVEVYISIPSDNPLRPSPHHTGGSVDLTLLDDQGKPLPMGTEFDEFSIRANTRFLEERWEKGEVLNAEEVVALKNRRLLYRLMTTHGFTNYCEEWWHFDYGNQFWSIVTGRTAFYGPVRPEG